MIVDSASCEPQACIARATVNIESIIGGRSPTLSAYGMALVTKSAASLGLPSISAMRARSPSVLASRRRSPHLSQVEATPRTHGER